MVCGGDAGSGFDGAVGPDDVVTRLGQRRAATRNAALLRFYDMMVEYPVQLVDQLPGTAIGHAHGAACGTDRPMFVDQFQQANLAGAEAAFAWKIEAESQYRIGNRLRPAFSARQDRKSPRLNSSH